MTCQNDSPAVQVARAQVTAWSNHDLAAARADRTLTADAAQSAVCALTSAAALAGVGLSDEGDGSQSDREGPGRGR